jgi:hypothetical protein
MRTRTLYLAVIQPLPKDPTEKRLPGYVRDFSFRWDTPPGTALQFAVSQLPPDHHFIFDSYVHAHAANALREYESSTQ